MIAVQEVWLGPGSAMYAAISMNLTVNRAVDNTGYLSDCRLEAATDTFGAITELSVCCQRLIKAWNPCGQARLIEHLSKR